MDASLAQAPVPPSTHVADAGSLRELLRVAIPLIISSGSLSVMGIVDRLLLTGLSIDALSASMPAGMMHWTILSIPFGVAMYVNTFVAQYEGAGRKDKVAACIWQGLWIALIGGGIIFALIPAVRMAIPYNGHGAEVQRLEAEYYSVLAMGSAPMLAANVFSAFFAGRGQTLTVMTVNLLAMVGNAVVDYLLIFGWGPIPKMGMAGAAWATVLANLGSCFVFGWLVWRESKRNGYPFREQLCWDFSLIRRMLVHGIPNGLQMLVDVGAYLMFILLAGDFGNRELAATNLAFNLNSMAFIPMIGMGTAVLTLVGRRVGEGRPELAIRTTYLAMATSGLYMLFFCVLYVGIPQLMIAPYSAFATVSDRPEEFEQVVPLVVVLLRFVAVYSVFDAMMIVFGNAIRGAGDVRFSLIATTLLAWLVMVVPCILIAKVYPSAGINGCWLAATANIVLSGLAMLWRFRQGHWKSMKVIE